MKIALNEENFAELVKGKEIVVEGHDPKIRGHVLPITVMLSDIGFYRMMALVADALQEQGKFGPGMPSVTVRTPSDDSPSGHDDQA